MEKQISKKQRRINTDNNILDAALIEFGNCGYTKAKLVNIAAKANISIGLIVQNFGSKEDMLKTLIKRELSRILGIFSVGDKRDWKTILGSIVDYTINLYVNKVERGQLCLKFFYTILNSYDTPKDIVNGMLGMSSDSHLVQAIKEGQKNNEVKDGDPIRLLGLFYRTTSSVISHCINFDIEPPTKEWFLSLLEKR